MTSSPLQQEAPLPENIFKQLRVASQLSHAELAAKMHISKHALIRLEQGLFERPLPTAVDFWLKEGSWLVGSQIRVTELTLIHGYEQFKEQTRDQNRHYFGIRLIGFDYGSGAIHPGHQLIALARNPEGYRTSVVGVAKALCIPQSTLNLWLTKWRNQKTVPKTIQQALLDIGYNRHEVKAFVDGYAEWREANK